MQHTLLHLEHAKATATSKPPTGPPPPRPTRRRQAAGALIKLAQRLDSDALRVLGESSAR